MSKTEVTVEMSDTKRRLLDAAVQLMLRRGFTATTVDEICAEADLTKGSFFHYFKSKDEIGEAALEHYFARQREKFAQAPFNGVADPLERLHGLLDFIGQAFNCGERAQCCLLGNFTQELALTHPRIRASCDDKLTKFAGVVETMLREAKTKHGSHAKFDPKSVATLFVSLMQGSMLLAKARQDKSVLAENLEHFRGYVDGLLAKGGRH